MSEIQQANMNGEGFYRVHIRKEALKFSAAHMTVFPDGTKESIHGHNYRTQVSIDLADATLSGMIPFSAIKSAMKAICAQWDEKLLLPEKCPHFKKLRDEKGELEFTLCGKRYLVPRDEAELLAVDNVITETLASEFCRKLVGVLDPKLVLNRVLRLEVRIEEMLGQGASFIWTPARPK